MVLKAKRKTVLVPREIELTSSDYQPTKVEIGEDIIPRKAL